MPEPKVSVLLTLVDQITKPLNGIEGMIKSFSKAVGAAVAAIAVGKLFEGFIEEAVQSEKTVTALGTAVRNTGNDFKKLSPALEASIEGVKRLSKYSDEDLRGALTNMITLTGDVAGSTKNLGLVADLAAARQIDLSQASDLVAKAMNGNVTGLNKLGFAGKDATTVLENMRASTAGFAENESKTFGGRLAQLTRGWDDFKEAMGRAILGGGEATGTVGKLGDYVQRLTEWVEQNSGSISLWVDAFLRIGQALGTIVAGAIRAVTPLALGLLQVIGKGIEGVGMLLTVGQNALRAIGINVGTTLARTLKDSGASMQAAAKDLRDGLTRISEQGEQQLTATLDKGVKNRKTLTADEQRAREKATKEAQEQLLALARLQTDAVIKITDVALQTRIKVDEHFKKLAKSGVDSMGGLEGRIEAIKKKWDAYYQQASRDEKEEKQRIQDIVDTTTGFARGLLDAGTAAGALSQELANSLTSAINLGESIGKIATATTTGGMFGALTQGIGALVNLGKTLFGQSPLAAAIEKNKTALDQLRGKIAEDIASRTPGRVLGGVQAALQGIDFSKFSTAGKAADATDKALRQLLAQQLLARGLGFGDLEQLAKDLGISITDTKGRVSGPLLQQLLEGLGIVAKAPVFGHTLAGERERIQFGLSTGTITDERAAAFEAASGLSPALAAALSSGDPLGALRGLARNLGGISNADLGELSRGDFKDALEWLIGLLSAAAEVKEQAGDVLSTPIGSAAVAAVGSGSIGGAGAPLDWKSLIDAAIASEAHLANIDSTLTRMAVTSTRMASSEEELIDRIDQELGRRTRILRRTRGELVSQ